MFYSIFYVVCALLLGCWLNFELKRKENLKEYARWLIGPVLMGITAWLVFANNETVTTNFILHASGGASVAFIYIYLINTFHFQTSWRVHLFLLFGLVSMLGVVNELFEYAVELAGLGVMAWDIHDTWRDLVANTTGAILIWLLYLVFRALSHKKKA